MKWLLAPAGLLAIGMIVAGIVAGSTLRARDTAVREGVLSRTADGIERELREGGPETAGEVLQRYAVAERGVSAIEVHTSDRVIARAGEPYGERVELPLFLGPAWRGIGGEGRMGFGQPPFRIVLWAARGVGDSSGLAALITWGSIVAALALLLFAAGAARGIAARQQAASLEAERARLETVSGAGAGLAHRIRNPLATIKATAQMLAAQTEGAERERATRIVDASLRIEALVDELLQFARPVEVHAEEIDLADTARSIVGDVRSDGDVHVIADREHVTSAIEELVANARALGDDRPEVLVTRRGRQGVVEVLDRGPGLQIDPARAFEPYVTTRTNGTGLGLASIRGLIRANGGEITLANRDGGGCVATILLPAVSG